MNTADDAVLLQKICRHLDASSAHLPFFVEQQLSHARQSALKQQSHSATARRDAAGLVQSVSRDMNDNSVPPEIEARLDQIRNSAVARFEQLQQTQKAQKTETVGLSLRTWFKSQLAAFNFSASAGMLATACILITAISLFYVNSRPTGTLTLEEEIGLVATAEDIELYENLEFYLWLAENESLTL